MTKKLLTLICIIQCLTVVGQIKNDTSLADKQVFGALGTSLLGYNNDIKSYFSVYFQTGVEYNVTKTSKLGCAWSLLKLNWTGLQADSSKFGQNYDRARYFSFSSDFQLFGRYIFNRTDNIFNEYDKYIELGLGYNVPYYFALHRFKGDNKIIEKYPNRYNDFYLYTIFYFLKPQNIPLGIKLEYHPFDIIPNTNYPDVAKFRVDLLISLFTENNDRK